MTAEQILAEIREANLSYLMLAQSLIRTDRDEALYRLGVSEETATMIGMLTPAQMMKIAGGNTLLCRFRDLGGALAVGFLIDHAGPSPGSVQGFQAAFALMAVVPLITWLLLREECSWS